MKIRKFAYLLLVALVLRLVFAFFPEQIHTDLRNSIDWGTRFWEYGPKYYYQANVWSFDWPNQPPGTVILYAAIRKVYEAVFAFFWFINIKVPAFPSNLMFYFEKHLINYVAKLPSIISDFGIAFLIFKFVKEQFDEKKAQIAALFFLFNPVIWYNSVIWGQYDSVNNFLVLLSFYLLMRKKLASAGIAFLISIYVKMSLLIFTPIFFIVAIRQKYKHSEYIKAISFNILVFLLIFIPFSDKNVFVWVYELYSARVSVEQLQLITANSFNLWVAVAGIHRLSHDILLGPLSYKLWGIILFTLGYIPAVIIVIKSQTVKSVLWSLSIIAISSFMLLTNMHERYLYPFFVVFAVIAFSNRKMVIYYVLFSMINIFNLYNFWWVPRINPLMHFLSFSDRLMPRILGMVSFIAYVYLYRDFARYLKSYLKK